MQSSLSSALALFSVTFLYSSFGVLTRIMGFELPIFFASFTRDLTGALILLVPLLLLGFISGVLLFGEKVSRLEALSLSISLLGLVLLYSVGEVGADLFKYVIWAFVGGMGAAVWNTFSKKISGTYSATQLNGLDFAVFAVIMLSLSLISGERWQAPAFNMIWLANLLFVLMFVVTGQLMIYGFKHLDAQKGSLIMLLEVVFGALIGWFFYQEAMSLGALFGGLLILTGAILPQLQQRA